MAKSVPLLMLGAILSVSLGMFLEYQRITKLEAALTMPTTRNPVLIDRYEDKDIVLRRVDVRIDGATRQFACGELRPEIALHGYQEQVGLNLYNGAVLVGRVVREGIH